MAHFTVAKGLDIPIAGAASGAAVDLLSPPLVAIDPRELRGFIPRLAAREGDSVKIGQPILHDKFNSDVAIVSPVAGTVRAVKRGHRRVITSFEITPDAGSTEAVQHRAWSASELSSISAEDAKAQLLAGGAFPFLRTRPLDHVPNPDDTPQAILIGAMETGPAQPGVDVLLSEADREGLQAAIYALSALTEGPVYLSRAQGSAHPALDGLQGVTEHTFSGPHPAGDPAVQVNLISPPSKGGQVWYLRAWDAAAIGRMFLTGRFDPIRTYAAAGTALKAPRVVRTVLGASAGYLAGELAHANPRFVRGSILTGDRIDADAGAGLLTRAVHVLPDEVERHVFGWAMPALGRWSFHKAFVKGFGKPSKTYDLRPGIYGGHRAIVPVGYYADVVATPDIVVDFLFKSIISGDLQRSIKLGLLDMTDEEAALCSYVCPSKTDFDVILREGLERYAKEA